MLHPRVRWDMPIVHPWVRWDMPIVHPRVYRDIPHPTTLGYTGIYHPTTPCSPGYTLRILLLPLHAEHRHHYAGGKRRTSWAQSGRKGRVRASRAPQGPKGVRDGVQSVRRSFRCSRKKEGKIG